MCEAVQALGAWLLPLEGVARGGGGGSLDEVSRSVTRLEGAGFGVRMVGGRALAWHGMGVMRMGWVLEWWRDLLRCGGGVDVMWN